MPANIENLRKLVDALRSGKYPKTKGVLHRVRQTAAWPASPVGWCCLGVACDVYHKETGDGEWVNEDNSFDTFKTTSGLNAYGLTAEVAEWLGLDEESVSQRTIKVDGEEGHDRVDIITINDTNDTFAPVIAALRATFPELAEPTT